MNNKIAIELNGLELIKYALFKDYFLPEELKMINLTQERILMTVKHSVNLSMVNISRAVGLEKGPFSQSVDKLEELGFIQRIRSVSDKRKIHLALTDEGNLFIDKVETSMDEHFQNRMKILTQEQVQEFYQALATINKLSNIIISQ
ncbi:MarR family winged helix-turn-helix transcriptional regulator [Faecalibacter rhinopitheci]|uniref:MarR family transcriptional regulator n=1 Tax=Faecalibacter rhinopitheci TaxID=2779678 RepID=A0A8J7KIL0_9FLAO|nr:MarR family transcriptional regulator [Faecalibacter rhinopitheci]MBF0597966.1 MarR family transcriptional regulator [Faecalibacter rhinopitheci]